MYSYHQNFDFLPSEMSWFLPHALPLTLKPAVIPSFWSIGALIPREAPKHDWSVSPLISEGVGRIKQGFLYSQNTCCQINWQSPVTWLRHGCFVDNIHIFQRPPHGSLCHVVGAKRVEEAGVHAKVIQLRKLHESDVEIFMKHQLIRSHLKEGGFNVGPKPNKPDVLETKQQMYK